MIDPTKTHLIHTWYSSRNAKVGFWGLAHCVCGGDSKKNGAEMNTMGRSQKGTPASVSGAHTRATRGRGKSVCTPHSHTVESGERTGRFLTPFTSSHLLCSAGTERSWGTPAPRRSGSHSSLQCGTSLWQPPKCQTPKRGRKKRRNIMWTHVWSYLKCIQVLGSRFKATICIFFDVQMSI